jgi:hypothetical protein
MKSMKLNFVIFSSTFDHLILEGTIECILENAYPKIHRIPKYHKKGPHTTTY